MNLVILSGRLGKDPELRSTQGGRSVTTFSVATEETWKDRDGNRQKKTEWSTCVAWGPTAEVVSKHFGKGDGITIYGKLQTRKYEKDGSTRYATEVIADRVEFPPGKANTDADRSSGSGNSRGQADEPSMSSFDPGDDDVNF